MIKVKQIIFSSLAAISFLSSPLQAITTEELLEYGMWSHDTELLDILMKYGWENPAKKAMYQKDYFAVFILIEYGVDINYRESEHAQSLMEIAIIANEISLVEYFLIRNADPTSHQKIVGEIDQTQFRRSDYYTTAVYDAIKSNRFDVIVMFEKYGVDLNKTCYEITYSTYKLPYKQTPIQFAIENKSSHIAAYLLSIGVKL